MAPACLREIASSAALLAMTDLFLLSLRAKRSNLAGIGAPRMILTSAVELDLLAPPAEALRYLVTFRTVRAP
jgi:hypothetical protein